MLGIFSWLVGSKGPVRAVSALAEEVGGQFQGQLPIVGTADSPALGAIAAVAALLVKNWGGENLGSRARSKAESQTMGASIAAYQSRTCKR